MDATSRTFEPPALDDPQAHADLEEVCRLVSEGRAITDPELRRRIETRADAARAEALRLYGVQQVAVDIVREMRDSR
jgi:hypothetical protein